jgi:hypothetical protein
VGLYGGLLQTYAANPNAGAVEYAFGGGLGTLFGGLMPIGAGSGLVGTLGGAGIGSYFGNAGMGAQVGGLVGGIAGGGAQGWLTNGFRAGLANVAWEGGGATIGAIGGGLYYRTPEGALFGANIGSFAGGIAQGARGVYRGCHAR